MDSQRYLIALRGTFLNRTLTLNIYLRSLLFCGVFGWPTSLLRNIWFLWARRHRNWSWDRWLRVIWSDECSVERGSGRERRWAYRQPHQKWSKEMVNPYQKGKDISIMVWGGFSILGGRSNLCFLQRDPAAPRQGYSARSYTTILEDQIPRIYTPGYRFMQDNAPIHTAYVVRDWLQDHGIRVHVHPPYSPDLNPQEHIWPHLKKGVYKVRPDIMDITRDEAKYRVLYHALEAS